MGHNKKALQNYLDEDGNVISTRNPNGYWDWYSIGGRWSGYFPLKKKDSEEDDYCDEATIGEVDWKKFKKEHQAPYCFITAEGTWVSRGNTVELMDYNEKSMSAWQKIFFDKLKEYPKDTPIIAIDFHT